MVKINWISVAGMLCLLFNTGKSASFSAFDSEDSLSLTLDSIRIENISMNLDTTLVGVKTFDYATDVVIKFNNKNSEKRNEYPTRLIDLKGRQYEINNSGYGNRPVAKGIYTIVKGNSYIGRIAVTKDASKIEPLDNHENYKETGLKKTTASGSGATFTCTGFSRGYENSSIENVVLGADEEISFFFHRGCSGDCFWYDWICNSNSLLPEWGFGNVQNTYRSLDKKISWYIDQAATGEHSSNNCGPATVAMCGMWSDPDFSGSAEEARDTYPLEGGWWYTNNVIDYLDIKSIPNRIEAFKGTDHLKEVIDNGEIFITCLNTKYLRRETNTTRRTGRFYNYADGHFLVGKGYRIADDTLFIESYDPNNWNNKYTDNSPMGKNRHYHGSDMESAITEWWNYLIIISAKTSVVAKKAVHPNALSPDVIPHNWGN